MKSLTTKYRICTSDVDIRKNYKAFAFMSMAQEMANWHASGIGFGYDDLIKDNISWVVSRMKVRYLRSPKWEEEIQFSTWHKGRDGVFSLRDFEVSDAEGKETLIQATSSWLLIDISSRRMLRPDHVLGEKSLSTALDRDSIAEHCGKITVPKDCTPALVRRHDVLYSDVDFNGHTNNAKYIEWSFDTLPAAEVSGRDIDCFQINFNHETRPGDTVELYLAASGAEDFFVEGRSADKPVFQSVIRLKP